ncbi:MAG: hypothetical protein ABIQ59_10240 [Nocardioidaceae bacterium]
MDDKTVEAVGKMTEALENTERARGHLYSFHQLTGSADLELGEGVDLLREAGHTELADRIEHHLVGRNVVDGRRHLHEAGMKEDRRTHGHPDHTKEP